MKIEDNEDQEEIKSIRAPRLDAIEKLYVRSYLSTLSHAKAYATVKPGLASYKSYEKDNQFSRRDNVQFHIALSLQEKAESLTISPELILEKLLKEALREGSGSNHAARIQALGLLGKHFGMFQEKKEDLKPVFNIINYSQIPLESVGTEGSKLDPPLESVGTEGIDLDIPNNIKITNYSE